MANFAVIKLGIVDNIIAAESKAIAEEVTGMTCVEYTNANPAGIGWSYDAGTKRFSAPTE
jgi:hypothetical protein